MGSVVALGESHGLEGFALVGVEVRRVAGPDDVRSVWEHLDDQVSLVILSQAAADVLAERLADRPDVLTAVLP
jgi:vacuolar-type H+-ATPase subunit F/Vma7